MISRDQLPADLVRIDIDGMRSTLIKKKIKFSSYMRKFRMERLLNHIWLTASSYTVCMVKYLRISSYIGKPFLIYDFVTASLWISVYVNEESFLFYQFKDQPPADLVLTNIDGMRRRDQPPSGLILINMDGMRSKGQPPADLVLINIDRIRRWDQSPADLVLIYMDGMRSRD